MMNKYPRISNTSCNGSQKSARDLGDTDAAYEDAEDDGTPPAGDDDYEGDEAEDDGGQEGGEYDEEEDEDDDDDDDDCPPPPPPSPLFAAAAAYLIQQSMKSKASQHNYPHIDLDAATESNNDTALTMAVTGGHEDLVKLLIEKGAHIEHRDKKGMLILISFVRLKVYGID